MQEKRPSPQRFLNSRTILLPEFCCQFSAKSAFLNFLEWLFLQEAATDTPGMFLWHWPTAPVLGEECADLSQGQGQYLTDSLTQHRGGQPAQLQPPTSTAWHHCTHHSLELDTCVNPSWNSVQRYRLFYSWTHTSLPSPGHLWGTNRTGKLRYDWAKSPAFTARSNVCEQQARHLEKSNTKHFNVGAGTYSTHAAVYRASQWRGW